MNVKYDHPEYHEPDFSDETTIEDLLFSDAADIYEGLYPCIPDEEFNFMQMKFEHHLQGMISEHEGDSL